MTSVPSLNSSPEAATQAATNKNAELGKDQFLKLFVAQLQHQDPMNPMQDSDFMGQMASFSTLEQVSNMANENAKIAQSLTTTSAVNRYLQSWDVSNLFVVGASAFPQNAAQNPTGTVGALAYWGAEAIRDRYLKNPGRLM